MTREEIIKAMGECIDKFYKLEDVNKALSHKNAEVNLQVTYHTLNRIEGTRNVETVGVYDRDIFTTIQNEALSKRAALKKELADLCTMYISADDDD